MIVLDSAFSASLSSPGEVTRSQLSGAGTIFNGVHSLPLSYRIARGQSTVWGAGDWGWYNQSDSDGTIGIAEVGGGHNFGPAQLNVSLGYARNKQDLAQDGELKAGGAYLYGEGLAPIVGGLWGIFSAYYQWGDADIERGYLNAGTPTSSSGSADTSTWALRARLEWDSAADLSGFRLNPYGEVSYSSAKMDSYTETGGGFPATYDSRSDKATDFRLGLNAAYPLAIGSKTRLLGLLEGVHRVQDKGANVSGQILGAGGFAFNVDGSDYDQNWFRAGLGVESVIGGGRASLMVNGATEGETPRVWLAARYQVAF